MPTPRAMFRILSVTCLLTRKVCAILHKYSIYYTYELLASNNFIIIVIFAENASFICKLRRHLLALMALTTPKPQNTDTNGIHATWA